MLIDAPFFHISMKTSLKSRNGSAVHLWGYTDSEMRGNRDARCIARLMMYRYGLFPQRLGSTSASFGKAKSIKSVCFDRTKQSEPLLLDHSYNLYGYVNQVFKLKHISPQKLFGKEITIQYKNKLINKPV